MLSPLPRRSGWAYCFAHSPSRISLPRKGYRVGLRIGIFEACSAFTHVTACTLAPSPIRDALYRRLQLLRCLHSCSGCFRLERSPGGTCTHWKAPPFHGAHPLLPSIVLQLPDYFASQESCSITSSAARGTSRGS